MYIRFISKSDVSIAASNEECCQVHYNSMSFHKNKNRHSLYIRNDIVDHNLVLEIVAKKLSITDTSQFKKSTNFENEFWSEYSFPKISKEVILFLTLHYPLQFEIPNEV